MEKLKINIPEGFEVDSFDKESGEIIIREKPKDTRDRIKNFDDVLKYHKVTRKEFEKDLKGLFSDEINYRKLKLIASALNEDWTSDWEDGSQYKYYPYFKMGSPSGVGFSYGGYDFVGWGAYSGIGSRLCFKSRELAIYAGQQFEDVYKGFLTLNN